MLKYKYLSDVTLITLIERSRREPVTRVSGTTKAELPGSTGFGLGCGFNMRVAVAVAAESCPQPEQWPALPSRSDGLTL